MKLERPLSELLKKCETKCVSGCCGLNAFDLSPVHIASFITRNDNIEINALEEQIKTLSINYGENGGSGRGVRLEEINDNFSAKAIDSLTKELLTNINVAKELIEVSEKNRYKNA